MKKRIFILLFIPFALTAQRKVSGKITDAGNDEAVAGASVFISNSIIGANTNAEGYYQLTIPEGGSQRLTVSYLGYQTVYKDIEPGNTPVEFNAALRIQEKELNEVAVTAKVKFRQRDIDLFWKTILGRSPSRSSIGVTNPEAVYYYYNSETRILNVTCREPLHIVNYETGYQIYYVLNYFTYDYNKNFIDWSDQCVFTQLMPDSPKQKDEWEKNRRKVYNISLTKFIRSLYNNSLYNDGFVLATLQQNRDPNNPYQISLLDPESILSIKSADNSKNFNLSSGRVMLICYGRPVNVNDLDIIQHPQDKKFLKNGSLFMNLLSGNSIRIFSDGTYTNKLLMAPVNLSNTLLGLNTKLPIEYRPEELSASDKEDKNAFDMDRVTQHFNAQMEAFPQEKIYLQTDRNGYVPGEKIWFKAYVTDAATLQPSTQSRYVYAELIDSCDSLIDRVMVRQDSDAMFYGYLFLSKIIPEGNYTLRAYTRYMENLGDDYFFKKNIRIGSLSGKNQLPPIGKGSGSVQTTVNDFQLPPSEPPVYSLTASQQNNVLTVGIRKTGQSTKTPCYLLGQCRGRVFYFSALQWTAGDSESSSNCHDITFPEEDLQAGVLQFVLFDEKMNPLSERLVFSKNKDRAKVEFHTDKALYNKHEKVTATLNLTDSNGNPLAGNLSVSVTDDKDIAVDSTITILSTLLLSSELKGYIENSAYYLRDNSQSANSLDHLMLTHEWKRYNTPEVVRGHYESPKLPFQISQEISGKVNSGTRSKPVAGSALSFMVRGGGFGLATTGKNGAFLFKDFEYPDSTSYFIQALGKKGSSEVKLVLDGESFPQPVHAPQSPAVEIPVNKEESNTFIAKAEQRSKYDEDMRTVQLGEVVVTGRRRIEKNKDEPRLQFWANIGSDVTVKREDFEKWHPRTVYDILRTIPGVRVSSDDGFVVIRESMTFYLNTPPPPLILIDGIEIAMTKVYNPLQEMSVSDIASIDIFKGPSTSAFGFRGGYGVISITTVRGLNDIRNEKNNKESRSLNNAVYTPLGYQTPVEFYSPDYEKLDAQNSIIPDYRTTLFWKPDIVVSGEGKEVSFEFYTSDFSTTYSVVIEGLTNDGKIVRQIEKIRVE